MFKKICFILLFSMFGVTHSPIVNDSPSSPNVTGQVEVDSVKRVFFPIGKDPDQQERIFMAIKQLETYIPSFRMMEDDLNREGIHVLIHPDRLSQNTDDTLLTLGKAGVHLNFDPQTNDVLLVWAEIKIDFANIELAEEYLEPIIAHEYRHVWEARFLYGYNNYFAYIEKDQKLPYEKRRIEISANKYENKVRGDLIKAHIKYKDMKMY